MVPAAEIAQPPIGTQWSDVLRHIAIAAPPSSREPAVDDASARPHLRVFLCPFRAPSLPAQYTPPRHNMQYRAPR